MPEESINITVNGSSEKVPAGSSLAWLIAFSGEKDKSLIVERNGSFVYPQRYGEVILEDGDIVELINPDFGG
jgi:thiamine biosynthesis protein ThiS